jgi:hypothetical protein
MNESDETEMDWKRVFGFLLMLAGAAGGVAALFYIWFFQMLLRYARDSLWDGRWFFLMCFAGLAVSIAAGALGWRLFRRPPA